MRYYVACLHTAPGGAAAKLLPSGYACTRGELEKIMARAPGIPLTFEHSGVHEAVGILQGQGGGEVTATGMHRVLSQLAVTAPEKAPIGHVVMAFVAPDGAAYCILELDDKAFPKISKMINAEHIKGVSLTHLAETLTPIEVSLCVEPARPGAMIRLATSELKLAILYTDQVKEGKIRTDKTMSAENDKPTEIERVLALLSDADRGIIEDRLIAMSKAAMDAKSNVAAAPFTMTADNEMTKMLFPMLMKTTKSILDSNSIDKETKDIWSTHDLMQPGNDMSAEAVTQAAARTLLCCNAMMMKQRAEINRLESAVSAEPKAPASRKRSAEPEVVAASAEAASTEIKEKAAEMSEMTPLQRAIAAEFVL